MVMVRVSRSTTITDVIVTRAVSATAELLVICVSTCSRRRVCTTSSDSLQSRQIAADRPVISINNHKVTNGVARA